MKVDDFHLSLQRLLFRKSSKEKARERNYFYHSINCCLNLETKFKNWTTDGRDFDDVTENYEHDEQYNKINNIPQDNSFTPETFIRASQGGNYKKKSKKKTRKLRK